MRKNTFLTIAAILAFSTSTVLTSCGNKNNSEKTAENIEYAVSGICEENGRTVYLYNMNLDSCIDSAVVADGKFSFAGTTTKDALMGVSYDAKGWRIAFFNDGIPVTTSFSDSTVQGSDQNERLAEYDMKVSKSYLEFLSKLANMTPEEKLAKAAEIQKEREDVIADQIEQVNKIYENERDNLIPVLFSPVYFFGNGPEAYDKLLEEKAVFANHPYVIQSRDKIAARIEAQKQAAAEDSARQSR